MRNRKKYKNTNRIEKQKSNKMTIKTGKRKTTSSCLEPFLVFNELFEASNHNFLHFSFRLPIQTSNKYSVLIFMRI